MAFRATSFRFLWKKENSKPLTMPFRIVACTFPDNLSRNNRICASSCSIHAQYGGLVLNSNLALCSRFKFVPSRAMFVFIWYPFHMLSCSVRIPPVFYLCGSEDFVSISYPVVRFSCLFRILFMWFRVHFFLRLCFWKVRVKLVSSRAVVVFIPYTFQAVSCSKSYPSFVSFDVRSGNFASNSYPLVRCFHVQFACVSFMWGLKSSWQSRIKSCAFVFSSYYSPAFSSSVHIPPVFNSCVVREFILNSCRALFAYSFQIRFQS